MKFNVWGWAGMKKTKPARYGFGLCGEACDLLLGEQLRIQLIDFRGHFFN